jgi:hypothetical protein
MPALCYGLDGFENGLDQLPTHAHRTELAVNMLYPGHFRLTPDIAGKATDTHPESGSAQNMTEGENTCRKTCPRQCRLKERPQTSGFVTGLPLPPD